MGLKKGNQLDGNNTITPLQSLHLVLFFQPHCVVLVYVIVICARFAFACMEIVSILDVDVNVYVVVREEDVSVLTTKHTYYVERDVSVVLNRTEHEDMVISRPQALFASLRATAPSHTHHS